MTNIFEIKDRNGKIVRLTDERWKHIAQEHPDVNDIEEIRNTAREPLISRQSGYDSSVMWHYRFNKQRKQYLMVAVKYLNDDGYIITSYYMRSVQ